MYNTNWRKCMYTSMHVCMQVGRYVYECMSGMSTYNDAPFQQSTCWPQVWPLASHHMVHMVRAPGAKSFGASWTTIQCSPGWSSVSQWKTNALKPWWFLSHQKIAVPLALLLTAVKVHGKGFPWVTDMVKRRTPCTCGMWFRAHASITWTSSCQRLLVWRRVQQMRGDNLGVKWLR